MNPELARRQMVAQQVRTWDVSDPGVLDVLGKVAREDFVPAGFEDLAYADTEIPLGYGQVMLRPNIEGRILQALQLKADDEVLEIGTGSGYLTACIAALCKSVTSIDIHEDFIAGASKNLETAGIRNVSLHCMDAMKDLPEGGFDAIVVTGSVPRMVDHFVDAMKPGGRLFIVVGESPQMDALLVARTDDDIRQTTVFETDIPALENVTGESAFIF